MPARAAVRHSSGSLCPAEPRDAHGCWDAAAVLGCCWTHSSGSRQTDLTQGSAPPRTKAGASPGNALHPPCTHHREFWQNFPSPAWCCHSSRDKQTRRTPHCSQESSLGGRTPAQDAAPIAAAGQVGTGGSSPLLEPPAPPGAKVAGSTQGFCSEEKAPSKGKETNKERKKRLISRHRLAPCRTPSQNPVISLPLAPRSPGCCRQASSHLTCHQAKCRLSTNHRGSIAAGKAERPEIRLPGRAGRSWGLSTGHRCTPRPPLRADPAPDTHRAAPSAHRTPRPRGDVPARTPHVLPPAPFGKSRPFLCPPAHPSAGRDSQRAAQYPN